MSHSARSDFLAASSLHMIDNWPELSRRASYKLNGIATLCGTSERHLRRFLKLRFGEPPKIWLDKHRLSEATALLLEGMSIKMVAEALHFGHASHFCRCFKRHYGITVRQFVIEHRAKSSVMSASVNDVRSC